VQAIFTYTDLAPGQLVIELGNCVSIIFFAPPSLGFFTEKSSFLSFLPGCRNRETLPCRNTCASVSWPDGPLPKLSLGNCIQFKRSLRFRSGFSRLGDRGLLV